MFNHIWSTQKKQKKEQKKYLKMCRKIEMKRDIDIFMKQEKNERKKMKPRLSGEAWQWRIATGLRSARVIFWQKSIFRFADFRRSLPFRI